MEKKQTAATKKPSGTRGAKKKKAAVAMKPLLGPRNWKVLLAGLAAIVLGYIALLQGPYDNPLSVTVAPILLVLGYCVLVPVALALKPDEPKLPQRGKGD